MANSNSSKIAGKERGVFQSRRQRTGVFLICGVIVVALALLFPKTHYNITKYKINDIARSSIIAPFDFPILKTEQELEADRLEAIKKVPFVFIQDKDVEKTELMNLQKFFTEIDRLRLARIKYDESLRNISINRSEESLAILTADSITFFALQKKFLNDYKLNKNSPVLKSLVYQYDPKNANQLSAHIQNQVKSVLSELYVLQILDIPKSQIISEKIAILQGGEEVLENPNEVLELSEAWTKAKLALQARLNDYTPEVVNATYDIVVAFLKPNLIYQKQITEKRQAEAIAKVPISKGVVLKNEKIVDANTRITPEIYQKIESMAKEQARLANVQRSWRRALPVIGDPAIFICQVAVVAIIFTFFMTFLFAYRTDIITNPKKVFLIGIIFVLQAVFAAILVNHFKISEYTIPITLAAMSLTILFDSRVAFVGIATICLIIGAQIGGNFNFIIVSVFVSTFAIYAVRQLRKRSQIFKSIIYIVLGYCLAIFATEMLKYSPPKSILNNIFYATINGVFAPFLAYGIIGLLENLFGITTDLSLLELADFNQPLLKLLSHEATGTFTHSVTVGNLAEAAADAIGANALLARIGSYYHDIGKLTKPEYFIENQAFDYNRHDKLAPNLSAIIILNHVKEGLRLANEYKLPQVIQDFISTHHGTTRVEYFYDKALKKSAKPDEINDADFRYPGPKPHTKETGIVMICETIEAVCRSLNKPTMSAIEKVVDSVIESRLKEGQLDECPLTLADLKKIKGDLKEGTGILPILRGIHHLRVEYPGQEEFSNSSVPNNKKGKNDGSQNL
ncbi:MAG TPA: HDIG domain-containing protein [Candidatus Marinimicrobia bacterium]|nr:HDIG domain-containing protein [Candidatus Neomarinimicrobiota bacterium]